MKLFSKSYKPVPVRRIFSIEINGKLRPLSIASSIDKIVQKAILIFLEPVFEKQFLNCSHGFWKNRSCHSCLSQIYYNWTGTKWFIETEFIDHLRQMSKQNLMSLINKNFFSYQISQIIFSLLKVGYIKFGASLVDSKLKHKKESFQGSLFSPLFCNILLHELDSFAVFYCNKVFHTRNNINLTSMKTCYGIRSFSLWRLTYIRYADSFLFGFIGSKKETVSILIIINWFVELLLGMVLNKNETHIWHHEKGVCFLGYKIWKKYGVNVKWEVDSLGRDRQNKSAKLNFSVPLEKLFLRYAERGFLQKVNRKSGDKFVGRRQDKWLFLNNDAAIVHKFNIVLKSIANYYSGSTQKSILSRLYFALKKSACLTIAHWNSKKHASWSKKKYGDNLIIPMTTKNGKTKTVELFKPRADKVKWHISIKGQLKNISVVPVGVPAPQRLSVVSSINNLSCAIFNCPNNAKEWHYIKHWKRIKKSKLQKKINDYTVKQIAVCKNHNLLINTGKYNSFSLKKLKGYIPSDFD